MQSNAKTGEIANLFSSFRTTRNSSKQFLLLQDRFNSAILKIASSYPAFWRDDFIQEGNLGLYNAVLKYPQDADTSQFYFYALRAIRTKMCDFYQSVIGRTTTPLVSFDIDGKSTSFKQSIFKEVETNSSEEDERYNLLDGIASPVDYVKATTLAIDFKYLLNKKSMKKNNFNEKEINAFNLHFKKGYNVSEVAARTKLSVPQTSKIISKAKVKVQQLLAYTSNKNF